MDKVYFVQEYVFKVTQFSWEWATLTRYGGYEQFEDAEKTFRRLIDTSKSNRKYRIIVKDTYGNEEIVLEEV